MKWLDDLDTSVVDGERKLNLQLHPRIDKFDLKGAESKMRIKYIVIHLPKQPSQSITEENGDSPGGTEQTG